MTRSLIDLAIYRFTHLLEDLRCATWQRKQHRIWKRRIA